MKLEVCEACGETYDSDEYMTCPACVRLQYLIAVAGRLAREDGKA